MAAKKITMLHIEADASQSELTAEDYTFALWIWLLKKESKANVKALAKELNVFPAPQNVYQAVTEKLFAGITV